MKTLTARCGLAGPALAAEGDNWPSYNRTPAGDRFAPQDDVTPATVDRLEEVCRYDLGRQTSFQTGPIVVDGTIYVTTDFDTIALDAFDCSEIWRTTEDYEPASPLNVNRGAALLDGRVFRGTQDGRVLAYDAKTGERLWEQTIADTGLGDPCRARCSPGRGSSSPATPAATTRA